MGRTSRGEERDHRMKESRITEAENGRVSEKANRREGEKDEKARKRKGEKANGREGGWAVSMGFRWFSHVVGIRAIPHLPYSMDSMAPGLVETRTAASPPIARVRDSAINVAWAPPTGSPRPSAVGGNAPGLDFARAEVGFDGAGPRREGDRGVGGGAGGLVGAHDQTVGPHGLFGVPACLSTVTMTVGGSALAYDAESGSVPAGRPVAMRAMGGWLSSTARRTVPASLQLPRWG